MIPYVPVIFVLSLIVSLLLNAGSIAILSKKPSGAVILSTLTNTCTWLSLYVIAKLSDWSIPLIIADALGDILGDGMTALRWPPWLWKILNRKKKKPYLKKTPATTA